MSLKEIYAESYIATKVRPEQQHTLRNTTLLFHPICTLKLFFVVLLAFIRTACTVALSHPLTIYVIMPVLAMYVSARQIPMMLEMIYHFEGMVFFVGWWMLLGVASSIGFGTGMHSGILFLFPYIINFTLASHACNSVHLKYDELTGQYTCNPKYQDSGASFWQIFSSVFPAAFIWGFGTACGEIPPYFVAKAAREAGEANAELEATNTEEVGRFDIMTRMKNWMIGFLKDYGFWAVFIFGAWPNMAFDLCGMACGHFGIPFMTFFGATVLGKSLVKVGMQAAVFVAASSPSVLIKLVAGVGSLSPRVAREIEKFAEFAISKVTQKRSSTSEEQPILKQAWDIFVMALILYFIGNLIQSVAQQEAVRPLNDIAEKVRKYNRSRANSEVAKKQEKKERTQEAKRQTSLIQRLVLVSVLLSGFLLTYLVGQEWNKKECLMLQIGSIVMLGIYPGLRAIRNHSVLVVGCFTLLWIPHITPVTSVLNDALDTYYHSKWFRQSSTLLAFSPKDGAKNKIAGATKFLKKKRLNGGLEPGTTTTTTTPSSSSSPPPPL